MHTLFRRNDKIGVSTDADTPPKNNLISITALNGSLWTIGVVNSYLHS